MHLRWNILWHVQNSGTNFSVSRNKKHSSMFLDFFQMISLLENFSHCFVFFDSVSVFISSSWSSTVVTLSPIMELLMRIIVRYKFYCSALFDLKLMGKHSIWWNVYVEEETPEIQEWKKASGFIRSENQLRICYLCIYVIYVLSSLSEKLFIVIVNNNSSRKVKKKKNVRVNPVCLRFCILAACRNV